MVAPVPNFAGLGVSEANEGSCSIRRSGSLSIPGPLLNANNTYECMRGDVAWCRLQPPSTGLASAGLDHVSISIAAMKMEPLTGVPGAEVSLAFSNVTPVVLPSRQVE